jgi:two-component system NtrC family response regulator
MTDSLEQMSLAASSEASVLITGETGTGKELFARAIHDNSSRSERPFVIVDCGALPETLIEHELFGHVRGAFTGADANREGLVKLADKGTLFLDEIGELPLSQQKAFLRVLQEKRYRPLGGKTEIPSDFRLVAATNKDLAELVRVGHFREDLLFRISSFTIHLPPLRDRTEDVKELALHRLDQLYAQYGLKPKGFSGDFLESLAAYDWPGNVRELYNVLEQALLAAKDEPILYPYHLPTSLRVVQARSRLDHKPGMHPAHTPRALLDAPPPWREYREEQVFEAESRYLTRLIEHTSGNITRAAEVSGLSRQRLHTLLKKHGMVRSYNRQPRKGDT